MRDVTRVLGLFVFAALLAAFAGCAGSDVRRSTGTYLDDGMITAKVKTDLAMDPVTKAHQIEIETYKGVVQLSGFVSNPESVQRAEELALKVKGVRSVRNNLVVRSDIKTTR